MKNQEELSKPFRQTDKPDSPIGEKPDDSESFNPNVTCTTGGQDYRVGDTVCIGKSRMQCGSNGQWFYTGRDC